MFREGLIHSVLPEYMSSTINACCAAHSIGLVIVEDGIGAFMYL
jgi:hypothetical protein